MDAVERLGNDFRAAMDGADTVLGAADLLCQACVDFLEVDGASVSLVHEGSTQGTFGSSGELSRRLDEYQFTFGEGPCLDAVRGATPVLVPDLGDSAEQRWPAFRQAVIGEGIRAVFALPVTVTSSPIGALDLFSARSGGLTQDRLTGGLVAARLAAGPLIKLMTSDVDWESAGEGTPGWETLASLERVEVYQATGMIVGALEVDPVEALVRLRAHAYAHGMTASEVAWAIVERQLSLEDDAWRRGAAGSEDDSR